MPPNELLVRDVMSSEVVTLNQNDKLVVADDVMKLGRIRHIPIVDDDGTLAGIVSQRDLFLSGLIKALGYGTVAQRKALDSVLIKESMKTNVITVSPTTPLKEAARTMMERKIGCVVAVEGGKIRGILTEGDFVALAAR